MWKYPILYCRCDNPKGPGLGVTRRHQQPCQPYTCLLHDSRCMGKLGDRGHSCGLYGLSGSQVTVEVRVSAKVMVSVDIMVVVKLMWSVEVMMV
jgi:hypothetical protein